MKNYFKSDVLDALDVMQQEQTEMFYLTLINFYVKYYHCYTQGYWSKANEFVETFYFGNKQLYWQDLNTKVYTALNCLERGYCSAMPINFEENLYHNVDFAMNYIKTNCGELVFIRTNNYKELVGVNTYKHRVKFFDDGDIRVKELHAFATKDYCLNAYKKWHHESFEVVDLSSYKYLYAISYKQMNNAVAYGDKEVDVIPFNPLVHFNTLTVNWGSSSFIRMDEVEEFVDLSNKWQVIATNEPVLSVRVESNK